MLFIPFLELKNLQGIMNAKNDNIGLGLSGSREITFKMGGDITLKESQDELTVFSFKVPVRVTFGDDQSDQSCIISREHKDFKRVKDRQLYG